MRDEGVSAYTCAFANGDTWENCAMCADECVFANPHVRPMYIPEFERHRRVSERLPAVIIITGKNRSKGTHRCIIFDEELAAACNEDETSDMHEVADSRGGPSVEESEIVDDDAVPD